MKPLETRLKAENEELADKIKKLETFISSSEFNTMSMRMQSIMTAQLKYMVGYRRTLTMRILLLEEEKGA